MTSTTVLEADYLVVGSGALGMAFTDALIAESSATVVMVDRHPRPGGHWNDAYSFVRLHQPSAIYGVSSLHLGRDSIDKSSLNRGLYELATGAEVCGYFDQVMEQKLLPTGRVQYFPACSYEGNGRFVSLLSGADYQVKARKAVVDATYTNTQLSSLRKPDFAIAAEASCVPPHGLVQLATMPDGYVIIGAGKTAIDACLWLLERGVEPSQIKWVRPRDAWLINRAYTQPGELVRDTLEGVVLQMEAAANAHDVHDLFARLSASRQLLRIDEEVAPTMYRCATVTEAELVQLRRIKQVIRMGHVVRIESDRIVLQEGTIPTSPRWLHVDCTASGISTRDKRPVFNETQITLQPVRACQPCFSAALIGYVEAHNSETAAKNALCTPIPYPSAPADWLRLTLASAMNEYRWKKDKGLRAWIDNSRLNYVRFANGTTPAPDVPALMQRFRDAIGPALGNLERLMTL